MHLQGTAFCGRRILSRKCQNVQFLLFQQVGSVIFIYAAFIIDTGAKRYFKTILVFITNNLGGEGLSKL